jgi:hypothetical protein
MAGGHKTCVQCNQSLPLDSFYRWRRSNRGGRLNYSSKCKPCKREHDRGGVSRDAALRKRYGFGLAEWERLFSEQGNSCKACGSQETDGKYWHTDHCHVTGEFRGILCHGCNTALGNVGDNVQRLEALISYLKNAEEAK